MVASACLSNPKLLLCFKGNRHLRKTKVHCSLVARERLSANQLGSIRCYWLNTGLDADVSLACLVIFSNQDRLVIFCCLSFFWRSICTFDACCERFIGFSRGIIQPTQSLFGWLFRMVVSDGCVVSLVVFPIQQ